MVVTNAGGNTTSAVAKLTVNAAAPTGVKLGNVTYVLETKANLGDANWTLARTITGDGSVKKLEAALAGITGFFRVRGP